MRTGYCEQKINYTWPKYPASAHCRESGSHITYDLQNADLKNAHFFLTKFD